MVRCSLFRNRFIHGGGLKISQRRERCPSEQCPRAMLKIREIAGATAWPPCILTIHSGSSVCSGVRWRLHARYERWLTKGRFDQSNGEKTWNRAILKYVCAYEFVHLKCRDFLNCPHSLGLTRFCKRSALWPLICMLHLGKTVLLREKRRSNPVGCDSPGDFHDGRPGACDCEPGTGE